jgi:hypothetical protein
MDVSRLLSSENVCYVVDRQLRIDAISAGYRDFATRNAPPGFLDQWGEGSSVVDAVSGPMVGSVRCWYEGALRGRSVDLTYHCHGMRRYRVFRMRILPMPGSGCLVEHAVVVDGALDGALDLDEEEIRDRYMGSDGRFIQCGHCRKTRSGSGPERWDWVTDLIHRPPTGTAMVTCPACLGLWAPRSARVRAG